MTMITGTRRESTVVWGVTGVLIADFRLELQYIELDNFYQFFVIVTVMAVTKYSKQPTYQAICLRHSRKCLPRFARLPIMLLQHTRFA